MGKNIILFVILVLGGILVARFWTLEDTWLCQNGEWIKHGNPTQSQPATVCPKDNSIPVACTMEAKLCSDGSAVGRIGPNCEFAPCPLVGSLLSETEARIIAEKLCIKGGETLAGGIYNKNSKTWWFDANLNSTHEGCHPACVVSGEMKTAEINWRCTGAIPPETKPVVIKCLAEQRNADICNEIYRPVCAKVNIQCFATPCNPINQTFSNACYACQNSLVESYTTGDCQVE